jgi:hypothetical protein
MEDDLFVANPGPALVLGREALPEDSILAELGKCPANGLVLRAAAFEPNLVAVLTSDVVHGRAVYPENDGDAPGVDFRVVDANGRVARPRLPLRLAALARWDNQDVLDRPAFERPPENAILQGCPPE